MQTSSIGLIWRKVSQCYHIPSQLDFIWQQFNLLILKILWISLQIFINGQAINSHRSAIQKQIGIVLWQLLNVKVDFSLSQIVVAFLERQ
jgi:hypothetical protein